MEMLRSVNLDKIFHRGSGDHLYYFDDDGSEVEVLDCLGGYGATFFGHNNPRLKMKMHELLDADVPFLVQASVRRNASLLCEKLGGIFKSIIGSGYIVTLASTGAECVEAAIKHSEHQRIENLKKLLREIKKQTIRIKERIAKGEVKIDRTAFNSMRVKIEADTDNELDNFFKRILRHNEDALLKKPAYICMSRSFHGKSTGAVKMTHNREYRTPYELLGIDVAFIDDGDFKALDDFISSSMTVFFKPYVRNDGYLAIESIDISSVAGMFVEPVQGEGGIRAVSKEFLEYSRKVSRQYGFPLVFDEIQCGMGRTGTFLYSQQTGVYADYYLLSKSLGGGMSKISALLVREDLYQKKFGHLHTSTFAEDDYSSAMAIASLEILETDQGLLLNCRERGEQLVSGLREVKNKYPGVLDEVRGWGLMIGIEFADQGNSSSRCIQAFSRQDHLGYVIAGYLLNEHRIRIAPTLNNKITLRIEPSGYVTAADCSRVIEAFDRLCEIIYKQNAYELSKYIIGKSTPQSKREIVDFRKKNQRPEIPPFAKNVAFTAFIIENSHFKLFDESLSMFTDEEIGRLIEKTYIEIDPQLFEQVMVKSATSEVVCLHSIPLMVNSDIAYRHLRNGDTAILNEKIEKAVKTAARLNCSAISFGGYTSILTDNCTSIVTEDISLSTGNSLTAGIGIEALCAAADEIGIDPLDPSSCLAAVGAGGNICSIYCEIMAEQVGRIILIGREGGSTLRLDEVASEILFNAYKEIRAAKAAGSAGPEVSAPQGIARSIMETDSMAKALNGDFAIPRIGPWLLTRLRAEMGDRFPIVTTTDISSIREANLVIAASNSPRPVIFPEMIGDRPTVICDIATPSDVHESVKHMGRDDLLVIQGGVVGLPFNPDFSLAGLALGRGQAYACLAEVLLMGFSGIREHYSYGRINKYQVKKMLQLARMHGFTLARFKNEKAI